eukprot:SAG31_NODE_84_length_27014_cov_3.743006_12_plen_45_part_00
MAEGVSGAACVLAFMNQAYQVSHDTALPGLLIVTLDSETVLEFM